MSTEPPIDPSPYLKSLQNNIRARPIPWEGAVRAGSITDEQWKKIKSVDKVRTEQRQQAVENDLKGYVTLLAGGSEGKSILESAAKRTDIIQYILVLARDLVKDVPSLVPALIASPDPYKPFLPLLQHSSSAEDPIPLLTSDLLISLVPTSLKTSSKCPPRDEAALPKLYTYLSTLTRNQDSGLQDIGVQGFSGLLRTQRSRELFWNLRTETVEPLMDILWAASGGKDNESTTMGATGSIRTAEIGLAGGVGLQLLYNVLVVIWQLSFEAALVGSELQADYNIIRLHTRLLRASAKEKTNRLLLSTLNNLLTKKRTTLLPIAVTEKLPSVLVNVGGRHHTDLELLDDLKELSDKLEEYTKKQTTFDEYSAEVLSGHLRWSPPHRNPTFWRDNARRILSEERGQLPKKLSEIISKSWETDKQVLAIACNDVGNLVKEVPDKRMQLEKLGLKSRVMELMADPDEAVRWESLKAVGEWLRYTFES